MFNENCSGPNNLEIKIIVTFKPHQFSFNQNEVLIILIVGNRWSGPIKSEKNEWHLLKEYLTFFEIQLFDWLIDWLIGVYYVGIT